MNPESTVSENDAVITYEELVIWAENYAKELIGKECVAIMCDSEMAAAMSMLACFAADCNRCSYIQKIWRKPLYANFEKVEA